MKKQPTLYDVYHADGGQCVAGCDIPCNVCGNRYCSHHPKYRRPAVKQKPKTGVSRLFARLGL